LNTYALAFYNAGAVIVNSEVGSRDEKADPTNGSHNASAVKINNPTSSLLRFMKNKYFEITL
jgi:hypothetical protein